MGVLAAFIFAAQMLNFPIAGGTSGHIIGAALLVIFLGIYAGSIVMAAVIIIQALIFADGGITAIGANIFNLAIIAPLAAYSIYSLIKKMSSSRVALSLAAFLAAWFSVEISAIAVTLELAASGTIALNLALPAMIFWHFFIGIGEGFITVAVINLIYRVRPDLLVSKGKLEIKNLVIVIIIILILVGILSPLASTLPDGLERVALDLGFKEKDTGKLNIPIPFKDYSSSLTSNPIVATSLAGLFGILVILAISFSIYLLIKRLRQPTIKK